MGLPPPALRASPIPSKNSGKFAIDIPEHLCYYVLVRPVSLLRGLPFSLGVSMTGKKTACSKEQAVFFFAFLPPCLPLIADQIFPMSTGVRAPGADFSPA